MTLTGKTMDTLSHVPWYQEEEWHSAGVVKKGLYFLARFINDIALSSLAGIDASFNLVKAIGELSIAAVLLPVFSLPAFGFASSALKSLCIAGICLLRMSASFLAPFSSQGAYALGGCALSRVQLGIDPSTDLVIWQIMKGSGKPLFTDFAKRYDEIAHFFLKCPTAAALFSPSFDSFSLYQELQGVRNIEPLALHLPTLKSKEEQQVLLNQFKVLNPSEDRADKLCSLIRFAHKNNQLSLVNALETTDLVKLLEKPIQDPGTDHIQSLLMLLPEERRMLWSKHELLLRALYQGGQPLETIQELFFGQAALLDEQVKKISTHQVVHYLEKIQSPRNRYFFITFVLKLPKVDLSSLNNIYNNLRTSSQRATILPIQTGAMSRETPHDNQLTWCTEIHALLYPQENTPRSVLVDEILPLHEKCKTKEEREKIYQALKDTPDDRRVMIFNCAVTLSKNDMKASQIGVVIGKLAELSRNQQNIKSIEHVIGNASLIRSIAHEEVLDELKDDYDFLGCVDEGGNPKGKLDDDEIIQLFQYLINREKPPAMKPEPKTSAQSSFYISKATSYKP